ncbi:MAG: hypothetical protein PHU66_06075 [Bacteroidaceae bacterium]|nr:hypothetical protein [Bacteroidaceae bacterium]
MNELLEKNSLIHPDRKRPKRHHSNFEQVDPHAEMVNAFINQTVTSAEGYEDQMPMKDAGTVINTKDRMQGNYE